MAHGSAAYVRDWDGSGLRTNQNIRWTIISVDSAATAHERRPGFGLAACLVRPVCLMCTYYIHTAGLLRLQTQERTYALGLGSYGAPSKMVGDRRPSASLLPPPYRCRYRYVWHASSRMRAYVRIPSGGPSTRVVCTVVCVCMYAMFDSSSFQMKYHRRARALRGSPSSSIIIMPMTTGESGGLKEKQRGEERGRRRFRPKLTNRAAADHKRVWAAPPSHILDMHAAVRSESSTRRDPGNFARAARRSRHVSTLHHSLPVVRSVRPTTARASRRVTCRGLRRRPAPDLI